VSITERRSGPAARSIRASSHENPIKANFAENIFYDVG
jgi:hypothetical protein